MLFNSPYVYYIEQQDFDNNYQLKSNIINPNTAQPYFAGRTIVMIQGSYCPHCNNIKPAYQKIAESLSKQGIEFATIQIDGNQEGEAIYQNPDFFQNLLKKPLEGVPLIVRFENGRFSSEYQGPRDEESIYKWVIS